MVREKQLSAKTAEWDELRPPKSERPRCGARCRSRNGAPCSARVVVRRDERGRVIFSRRCRLHGGLSTGPRTPEGRDRCREAGRRGAGVRWRSSPLAGGAPGDPPG